MSVSTRVLIPPGSTLTPRERAVLNVTAQGLTAKQTGVLLGITEETVKSYRQKILVRLGARNATHAVAIGFREGLLS